ncbi:hypothetical protein LEMLEM_LOCUS4849 [Lemmus lemmus]
MPKETRSGKKSIRAHAPLRRRRSRRRRRRSGRESGLQDALPQCTFVATFQLGPVLKNAKESSWANIW